MTRRWAKAVCTATAWLQISAASESLDCLERGLDICRNILRYLTGEQPCALLECDGGILVGGAHLGEQTRQAVVEFPRVCECARGRIVAYWAAQRGADRASNFSSLPCHYLVHATLLVTRCYPSYPTTLGRFVMPGEKRRHVARVVLVRLRAFAREPGPDNTRSAQRRFSAGWRHPD